MRPLRRAKTTGWFSCRRTKQKRLNGDEKSSKLRTKVSCPGSKAMALRT